MATLETWLRRREAREPLQHILGTTEFFGLSLEVTPAAMVPRPETETLAALGLTVLETLDPGGGRVLDLGTGGGAVALAIKHHRPTAEVMATDISKAALDLARRNASRLDLEAVFIRSDLLDHPTVADFAAAADLLLANPPTCRQPIATASPPRSPSTPRRRSTQAPTASITSADSKSKRRDCCGRGQ